MTDTTADRSDALVADLARRGAFVSPLDDRHRGEDPLAPRPVDLRGRTVVLLDIAKNRGAEFLDRVEVLLQRRGAATLRVTKEIFSKPAAPELIRWIANRGDLAVEGLAD